MIRWVSRTARTFSVTAQNWSADGGSFLAAAVAYYTAVAFLPLLLVLLSALGYVLKVTQTGRDAQQEILAAVGQQVSPALQANVKTMLDLVQDKASVGGPVGLGMLLIVVIALFAHVDFAFNRIWNLDKGPRGAWGAVKHTLLVRLRAFLMLSGLLLLIVVVFFCGLALSAVQQFEKGLPLSGQVSWTVQIATTVALNTCVFTLFYRFVPDARTPWRAAILGGVFAAVVWEIGRLVLSAVVIGQKYNNAYGVVGSFLAIMLWAYYGATVMLFGAELVQTLSQPSAEAAKNAKKHPHRG
jgi:membrane protein